MAIALLLISEALKAKVMFNPIRQNDAWGDGYFGASRGNRPHLGVDYVVNEGEVVYAPCDMDSFNVSYPYSFDANDNYILTGARFNTKINGVNFDGRMWYFTPYSHLFGRDISKGTPIGVAQTLQHRYAGITDHLHFQLRTETETSDSINYKGWYYVDPDNWV
jgi:murein DD-endopeptidase MepM/ murein hydrolase activator NlpD